MARTHSKDRHICQTVHTLVCSWWECTIHNESGHGVLVVDVVVIRWEASDVDSWQTRSVLVHLVVLTVVWVGTNTLGECVARIPVAWEEGVGIVELAGVDVLAQTGVLVGADCLALLAVGGGLVLSVS